MRMRKSQRIKASAAALLFACTAGCLAERPVVATIEPAWSSRDGATQLSNDEAWQAWYAEASANAQPPIVISVEQRVR